MTRHPQRPVPTGRPAVYQAVMEQAGPVKLAVMDSAALASDERLGPEVYTFGVRPLAEVPASGQTKFA